jgi:hypothetical protein
MAIADIVQEIDAYIARLRQARDLLAASLTGELRARESYTTKQIASEETAPTLSGKRRSADARSRSKAAERKVEAAERPSDSGSEQLSPVAPQAVEDQQPLIAPTAPAPVPVETPERAKLATPRRRTSSWGVRAVSKANREPVKPTNALSSSMASKIVAVSAAELQRERERAAQSVAVRPKVSWTGQTGRLAFEALFKNEPDNSQANGGTWAVGGTKDSFK